MIYYFVEAMKKYVVFKGRARRAEYWYFTLCVLLISIIAVIIDYKLHTDSLVQNIVSLGILIPSLSVAWRRMHDVGKPGGYCFIPIYNFILSVSAGDTGPNEYGPDPKEYNQAPIENNTNP